MPKLAKNSVPHITWYWNWRDVISTIQYT